MMQLCSLLWDLPTLLRTVPGRRDFASSLAPLTSWRIGGPADVLVRVETLEDLRRVHDIAMTHDIPLSMIGGGSNLLIRDGGIRGIVVVLRGIFRRYGLTPCRTATETAQIDAGAGASLSRVALQTGRQGWSGLEFAYGIPGTIGGAMVMNAGTNLGDMSRVMRAARMLLPSGQVQEFPVSACGLQYRTSAYPPGAILLAALLRVQRGDAAQITEVMRTSYARRQATQPLTLPNAGSVFKNPPGAAAGRLIEALGLKGARIGGAMIAPLHANFIVNMGQATATDVETLMAHVQEKVAAAYGLELAPEVRIVGEEA